MSVRRFIREREEKRELIDEFKNMILKESHKEVSSMRGMTIDDIFKIFINIGNMSYSSGDMDVFEYFLESLFELVNIDSETVSTEELLRKIYHFGLMSAHHHNINLYSVILRNLRQTIYELKETKSINNYLDIIKNLALQSEKENFEIGILETVYKLIDINEYFIENNLQINNIYLKNIIISLIYSSEITKNLYLKNKILKETKEILTK